MLLNLLVSLEPTQMTPMPWNIHLQMEYSFSNLKKQDTLKIDGGALETMLPSFVLTMPSILIWLSLFKFIPLISSFVIFTAAFVTLSFYSAPSSFSFWRISTIILLKQTNSPLQANALFNVSMIYELFFQFFPKLLHWVSYCDAPQSYKFHTFLSFITNQKVFQMRLSYPSYMLFLFALFL